MEEIDSRNICAFEHDNLSLSQVGSRSIPESFQGAYFPGDWFV